MDRSTGIESKCLVVLMTVMLFSLASLEAKANIVERHFNVVNNDYVINNSHFIKVYDSELGRERLIRNTVIVEFKENSLDYEIEDFLYKKELEIVEELGDNTYLCRSTSSSRRKFLRSLNSIKFNSESDESWDLYDPEVDYTNKVVASFDLNEYKTLKLKGIYDNPDGHKQWHLENDGNNGFTENADIDVEQAWDFARGEGIKVAVIDSGFDIGHPDINYYHKGFNALRKTSKENPSLKEAKLRNASAPKSSDENHGTAVAGIIAARDNDMGVIGVAPEAKVIPIRLISDNGQVSTAQILSAFNMAEKLGAQIINCSWGTAKANLKPGEKTKISKSEIELYKRLSKRGNKGKGILIFFASGNTGDPNFNNSPEARIPEVIAVGASNSQDYRAKYSVYGPELDFVVPGGAFKPIYTTDRRDRKKIVNGEIEQIVTGYSKGMVAKSFRGTSAATPVAAGIAALILSANPNLTAKQVRKIMIQTAYKNDSKRYKFKKGKDLEMGYGRLNAAKAVEKAVQMMYEN